MFGYLKYVGELSKPGDHLQAEVECVCGKKLVLPKKNLMGGKSKSCGCKKGEMCREKATKHGGYGTPAYKTWADMKKRVRPDNPRHKYYYDKGVRVCEKWDSFEGFYEDMGDRPSWATSLDRIDNEGDYCKENCRWATGTQQANNKSNNLHLTYRGKTYTQAELARAFGIPYPRLQMRLRSGWSVLEAVETPKLRNQHGVRS